MAARAVGRMIRRPLFSAVVAVVVGLAAPAGTSALLVWSLTVTPISATGGQTTSFTLTATNLDALFELGCLEVTLPSSFEVHSVSDPVHSTGRDWSSFIRGTTVIAFSESGGGRLETAQSVSFVVTARPTVAGATTWPNHAHQREDCSGEEETGVPLSVTVLAPLLATPTPTPAPASATPTPTPTPLLTLPSLKIAPTPNPMPTPTSTATPTPANAPGTSPSPTPSSAGPSSGASPESGTTPRSASPSEGDGESSTPATAAGTDGASATVGSGDTGGAVTGPRVSFDRTGLGVELGAIGLLDGAAIWAVPAATIAGPGLLILLFIALQAAGVAAWIPAVRRLRGKEERPR